MRSTECPSTKIIPKYAHVGGGNTDTTTSSAFVDMPNTTINYTSNEITGPTNLVINWAARLSNSNAGQIVATQIVVDGVAGAGTFNYNPAANQWVQHATNSVVSVSAGAHTIKIQWSAWTGGTAAVGDRDLTVLAIPE